MRYELKKNIYIYMAIKCISCSWKFVLLQVKMIVFTRTSVMYMNKFVLHDRSFISYELQKSTTRYIIQLTLQIHCKHFTDISEI